MNDDRTKMKTTDWRALTSQSSVQRERMRVTYGFHKIHEQEPYFSITAEIENLRGSRWCESAGGCQHELIAEHFPELADLIRWHLWGQRTGAMHYVSNGAYFLELHFGIAKATTFSKAEVKDWLQVFKDHCAYGVLPSDQQKLDVILLNVAAQDSRDKKENALQAPIRDWMIARLPLVNEAMRQDMVKHDVAYFEGT